MCKDTILRAHNQGSIDYITSTKTTRRKPLYSIFNGLPHYSSSRKVRIWHILAQVTLTLSTFLNIGGSLLGSSTLKHPQKVHVTVTYINDTVASNTKHIIAIFSCTLRHSSTYYLHIFNCYILTFFTIHEFYFKSNYCTCI